MTSLADYKTKNQIAKELISAFVTATNADSRSMPDFRDIFAHYRAMELQDTFMARATTIQIEAKQAKEAIIQYFQQRNMVRMDQMGDNILFEVRDGQAKLALRIHSMEQEIFVRAAGDKEEVEQLLRNFKEEFPHTGVNVTIAIGYKPDGTLRTETRALKMTPLTGKEHVLYPFLQEKLPVITDAFLASNQNAMLLIGPPGTGKSSMLRQLVSYIGKTTLLVNNRKLFTPELVSSFRRSKAEILVIEDADLLIGKRENGNEIMAELLNLTDGMLPNNKKVIFSTNLASVNKVDEALLRPGRMFTVLKFRKLTPDEAGNVALAFDKPFNGSARQEWTLAEILNPEIHFDDSEARKASAFGFSEYK